jgi:hypothetical protein
VNINDIKKGMTIRISKDISITERHWSLDPEGIMLSMRGQTFKVENVTGGVGIHKKNFTYTFCPEDMRIPEIVIKVQPPVMFDPNNICK